ncbi:MAG: hypothetical protein AB7S70_11355 [Hyphomicrobium sp.]|uniref:hypothetical protein n=1 Tax=Hyphomicrobium sp. TaxID=82 RepID=UPI003D1397D1
MAHGSRTPVKHPATWLAVLLAVALVLAGLIQYGFSAEVHQRFWVDLMGRADGPMTFRFFLQPAMAAIAAAHDAVKDVREGHKAFFWTALRHPTQEKGRLREGLISTTRIMLLGIGMDVIYQARVFDRFYPAEAVMIAILLAVIPYFVLRWIFEHVARVWPRQGNGSAL